MESLVQQLVLARSRLGTTISDQTLGAAVAQLVFKDASVLTELPSSAGDLALRLAWLAYVFIGERDPRVADLISLRLHMMFKGESTFAELVEDLVHCLGFSEGNPYLCELMEDTIALQAEIGDRRERGVGLSPEVARIVHDLIGVLPPQQVKQTSAPQREAATEETAGVLEQLLEAEGAKRWGRCIALAGRILEQQPRLLEVLRVQARAQQQLGLYRHALTTCDRALALRSDGELQLLRGNCLFELEHHEQAYLAFREGLHLSLDGRPDLHHRNMARALCGLGQLEAAHRELTFALAHRPDDNKTEELRADLARRKGS
jgi:tetratricopeptide (TPR) repeat protein